MQTSIYVSGYDSILMGIKEGSSGKTPRAQISLRGIVTTALTSG